MFCFCSTRKFSWFYLLIRDRYWYVNIWQLKCHARQKDLSMLARPLLEFVKVFIAGITKQTVIQIQIESISKRFIQKHFLEFFFFHFIHLRRPSEDTHAHCEPIRAAVMHTKRQMFVFDCCAVTAACESAGSALRYAFAVHVIHNIHFFFGCARTCECVVFLPVECLVACLHWDLSSF